MSICILSPDLLISTRIMEAARQAGRSAARFERVGELPPVEGVDVLFVDWGSRSDGWGADIAAYVRSAHEGFRLVVFGSHTDVAAHQEARAAGLLVIARSKLVADLPRMLG